jgi:hypothetical protein
MVGFCMGVITPFLVLIGEYANALTVLAAQTLQNACCKQRKGQRPAICTHRNQNTFLTCSYNRTQAYNTFETWVGLVLCRPTSVKLDGIGYTCMLRTFAVIGHYVLLQSTKFSKSVLSLLRLTCLTNIRYSVTGVNNFFLFFRLFLS